MTVELKCDQKLILHGVEKATCQREFGHRGRHKAKVIDGIYSELEWTNKKLKRGKLKQ